MQEDIMLEKELRFLHVVSQAIEETVFTPTKPHLLIVLLSKGVIFFKTTT